MYLLYTVSMIHHSCVVLTEINVDIKHNIDTDVGDG